MLAQNLNCTVQRQRLDGVSSPCNCGSAEQITDHWILPHALVFQLSIASGGRIHGGNGIISHSASAKTYGSYIILSSHKRRSVSSPAGSCIPFFVKIPLKRDNSTEVNRPPHDSGALGAVLKTWAISTTA